MKAGFLARYVESTVTNLAGPPQLVNGVHNWCNPQIVSPSKEYRSRDMALPERQSAILTFVVEDYIETANPVSSNAVAVDSGLRVSSATIRNEMGMLKEDGYLIRPHASSGAIPSEKGYRHFVDSLGLGLEPTRDFVGLLNEQMDFGLEDIDAWVQIASLVVADLIGALAFITTPRSRATGVKGIELLRLQDMLVMLVLIMHEARVYRQLIELNHALTDSELEITRNKVNAQLSGKRLDQVVEMSEHRFSDVPFERQVMDATVSVLRRNELAPGERYMSGFSHFISEPEMVADPESGALALSALESDDAFATLVSGISDHQQPVIFIGSDNPTPELQGFSVIMCGYGADVEANGVVGLVSPMRTAYDRSIPVVNFTADALNTLVNRSAGL